MENKRSKKWVYLVLAILLLALLAVGIFLYQIYSNGPEDTKPSTPTTTAPTTTMPTKPHVHDGVEKTVVIGTTEDCVHTYLECACGWKGDIKKSEHSYVDAEPTVVYENRVALRYEIVRTCSVCAFSYTHQLSNDEVTERNLETIESINAAHNWVENEIEVDESAYRAYLESKGLTDDTSVADGYLSRYFEKTITCEHCDIAEVEVSRRDEPIPQLPDNPDKPHVCAFTHREVVIKATCTEGGKTVQYCVCGENKVTSKTAALGHKYGAWEVVKAATCQEQGIRRQTCTRTGCTASKEEGIRKTSHTYGEAAFVDAGTCEGAGENVFTCTVCGNTKKETVHGKHVYGEWQYVASTYIGKNLLGQDREYGTHSARFRECTKCQYKYYEYFENHRCEYGAVFDISILTQIDTGCKNRVIHRYTCSICGYAWEEEALDPRTREPLYGAHKYVHTEKAITELTATTDAYTLITDVCSVCNDKKWQVKYQREVPSTPEAWKMRYEIRVRFSDSYDHNLKMSGTGDPDPRWTEHPEWLKKYTNFKYDGETGELLEYTVIWWSKNGNRYETVINIQDCYELFLEAIETGRVTLPDSKKPENCIAKFDASTLGLSFLTIGWS